jgi:hypothetical protein
MAHVGNFSGPEVMNDTCGETTHTTNVDRGFIVYEMKLKCPKSVFI